MRRHPLIFAWAAALAALAAAAALAGGGPSPQGLDAVSREFLACASAKGDPNQVPGFAHCVEEPAEMFGPF